MGAGHKWNINLYGYIYKMNLIQQWKENRIGPEMWGTHWLLYVGWGCILLQKKLGGCGEGVELRPGCTLIDMDMIELGDNVIIRPGAWISANAKRRAKVKIENDVLIAPDVFITVNSHNYQNKDKPIRLQGGNSKEVVIKNGAWLGTRSVILTGVTVGRNSVVAAGSVVIRNVPDYAVVAGVPAKIIRNLK